ncbi:Mrp/NBP35 family ATP-binding protein [Effusibacillus lacus]|uniref:Iron-sulfur cluster carrier protein n=1 Tax=Effusibacillus lacus TaxID=1348429 RepID=A0A292YG24_9BACL|nr:Mrp/NBP35 family ATP-binding protein [Effusibacillus lacus]TCS69208.1 ATP-binding protein involved in chromosome partitioning [Effusibacillus lacus]GAX89287.1 ATP-binding protein [Effusibacillus lacus]
MITEQAIMDALRKVEDPEVHRSIVELGMVKRVEIQGDHVAVEVLLTVAGCPLRNKIDQDVRAALASVPGVRSYDVFLGTMSDEERKQFAAKVRAGQADPLQIAGQPEVPPLLRDDAKTVFIAVASGKGGVGKSTATANLAVAFSRLGYKVGVIDADIYGFSLPNIFQLGDRRPALVENMLMPVQQDGVKIISMGFFVHDNTPVVWRGPMLGKMLRNFFSEVYWGDLDVMLLDLPPGTGDVALDVHTLLPKSKEVIVTTPQSNATEVAARAGTMAIRTNHEILGVIENMSYFEANGERHYIFGKGGGERLARELNTDLLGQIPLGVATASGSGIFPNGSEQAQIFESIAKNVAKKAGLPAPAAAGH